ncbi:hypothetical protein PIB30_026228 [Stylosanthes scabra]|uniref:Uncharacterized protein n=1 Tax=Stylosanthes scabra TaxID=79078 RepID=A0ABU6Q9V9_9FABA|nr:hypothetical protein [Stylosanthes scabra]
MCQETLDICLDQVSHLCPGVDFSAITLKSRWDPKGRRIFVPQEFEVEGSFRLPRRSRQSRILWLLLRLRSQRLEMQQVVVGNAPLKNFSALGDQFGEVPWCLFRPLYRLLFGLILKP